MSKFKEGKGEGGKSNFQRKFVILFVHFSCCVKYMENTTEGIAANYVYKNN